MAETRRRGPHGPGGHGSPRGGYQKPKNMGKTVGTLLGYVGKSRWLLAVVAVYSVVWLLASLYLSKKL